MKVAVIQMVSTGQWAGNQQQAQILIEAAARQGAELVVLPEYFCLIGQKDTDKLDLQEPFGNGPIQRFLSQTAQRLGLWVVGGTLPLSTHHADHVYNSSLAFSPAGDCVARYDKIH